MAVSKNTVAVKILGMLTPEKSFDFLVENFGFTTLVESMYDSSGNYYSDINYSPLALGGLTKGVTVLEMTAAG